MPNINAPDSTVTITSHQNGDPVSNTIVFKANVVPGSAAPLLGVVFWVDDRLPGIALTAPNYTVNYDTTVLTDGDHVFKVKVVDLAFGISYAEVNLPVTNNP